MKDRYVSRENGVETYINGTKWLSDNGIQLTLKEALDRLESPELDFDAFEWLMEWGQQFLMDELAWSDDVIIAALEEEGLLADEALKNCWKIQAEHEDAFA